MSPITAAEQEFNATAEAMGAEAEAQRAMDAPDPWRVQQIRRAYPHCNERQAAACNLRELADEVLEGVDGGEECRGRDSRLSAMADGMLYAAMLLEKKS